MRHSARRPTVYRRITRLTSLFVLAVLLLLAGGSHQASAQSFSQNITLSPASTDVALDAGTSVTRSIEVINSGSDDFNVTLSVAPYRVSGIEYDPKFNLLPGATEVTSWVRLEKTAARVESQSTEKFQYSISIPANTPPGGHYGVLFAETSPLSTSTSGVVPHNRVGNILYIRVNGPIETGGSIAAKPLSSFLIQDNLPIGSFISNTGGSHFVSKATFTVKNLFGQTVFDSKMERYILPQTERDVSVEWTPPSPINIYTISRSATIADQVQSAPDQTVLYVKPWFLAVLFAILLTIGITLTIRTLRRSRNRRQPKITRKHGA